MSISHLLEDFGAYTRGSRVSLTDVALEEQRLEAFENGYQAGWDDATKAQAEDSRRISADFAQNLQDLSFTYHEAYAGLLSTLDPLLREMVNAVLPKLASDTLGERVAGMLHELVRQYGQQPAQIVAAPANITALEAMVDSIGDLPFQVSSESSLADGQVFIRFGEIEQQIDLTEVLDGIEQAVSGFFEDNRKETA